jgi:hypothetical protein
LSQPPPSLSLTHSLTTHASRTYLKLPLCLFLSLWNPLLPTGYAVDVSLPSIRVAIEADGPTHTSRTNALHMLGATAMKRRHLQLMGWHVINITFDHWDALGTAEKQQAFLQGAISDALDDQISLP